MKIGKSTSRANSENKVQDGDSSLQVYDSIMLY